MLLRNGMEYRKSDIKKDGLEIIDCNVVRHAGMTRIPSKEPTHFQELIEEIKKTRFATLTTEQLRPWAEKLFGMPSFYKNSTMFSRNDYRIKNAYNDNYRRYFESVLAKEILTSLETEKTVLPDLVKDLTRFLKDQYTKSGYTNYLKSWENAKKSIDLGAKPGLDSLKYFSNLRNDLEALLKEKHFSPSWVPEKKTIKGVKKWGKKDALYSVNSKNECLRQMYALHYLTHRVSRLKTYKNASRVGIVEIYKNDNRFFNPKNRGRVSKYGFNLGNQSFHLGIFRSSDVCSIDMRKPGIPSKETRCPDRLYMEKPEIARNSSSNMLNYFFANPYNSCYVNGLSGSLLLEIRFILFYALSIKQKAHKVTNPKLTKSFHDPSIFQEYFMFMASLFVYFEGGHTFSEIFSVFGIDEVKKSIDEMFMLNTQKNTNQSMAENIIYSDTFLSCLQKALLKTVDFYRLQKQKVNLHQEIHAHFTKNRQ